MTGVEFPAAGRAAFQRTFVVRSQFTGRFFSADTPWPVAPRQPGQPSALANAVQLRSVSTQRLRRIVGSDLVLVRVGNGLPAQASALTVAKPSGLGSSRGCDPWMAGGWSDRGGVGDGAG